MRRNRLRSHTFHNQRLYNDAFYAWMLQAMCSATMRLMMCKFVLCVRNNYLPRVSKQNRRLPFHQQV